MQSILGIIAVAIGFVGFAIYFRSIFKHNIKPHLFSWLIWGLSGGIVFVAQFLEGAGPGAWAMGAICRFYEGQ